VAAVAPASFERVEPRSVDATRDLYERHSRRILGYCVSLLGSREDAEDAVQTTFMNAQRALRRGVVPEHELAWLFKIARNVCNNRRMAVWRRGRVESVRDLDTLQDAVASPEHDPSVSVEDLTRALSSIPARQRRALMLREWQGLSYAEIGTELGVSVAAVETLIFRARKSVAEGLERSETTRLAGLLTTALSVVRWLVKGGSAPLKIAAATATAVTVAIVPAAGIQQATSQAVVPSDPSAAGVAPRTAPAVRHTAKKSALAPVSAPAAVGRRPAPPAVAQAGEPAATSRASGTGGNNTEAPLLPKVPDPVGALPKVPVPVPSVPLPPVELPPVGIPDVQVPPLQLPKIEPPGVEAKLPPLPPLPRLP
jgi:RNA polymerase sigma-70 factor (ECF subfamily)